MFTTIVANQAPPWFAVPCMQKSMAVRQTPPPLPGTPLTNKDWPLFARHTKNPTPHNAATHKRSGRRTNAQDAALAAA